MNPILYIPQIGGISIEVFFILLILGFPVYFVGRRLYKKARNRKVFTWLTVIIATPIIYFFLAYLVFASAESYPHNNFDKRGWSENKEERYQYAEDIINSKILIGKTKKEVIGILGDENNPADSDEWYYDLGFRPEIGNIDPDSMVITYKDGKVIKVEQHQG